MPPWEWGYLQSKCRPSEKYPWCIQALLLYAPPFPVQTLVQDVIQPREVDISISQSPPTHSDKIPKGLGSLCGMHQYLNYECTTALTYQVVWWKSHGFASVGWGWLLPMPHSWFWLVPRSPQSLGRLRVVGWQCRGQGLGSKCSRDQWATESRYELAGQGARGQGNRQPGKRREAGGKTTSVPRLPVTYSIILWNSTYKHNFRDKW